MLHDPLPRLMAPVSRSVQVPWRSDPAVKLRECRRNSNNWTPSPDPPDEHKTCPAVFSGHIKICGLSRDCRPFCNHVDGQTRSPASMNPLRLRAVTTDQLARRVPTVAPSSLRALVARVSLSPLPLSPLSPSPARRPTPSTPARTTPHCLSPIPFPTCGACSSPWMMLHSWM